MDTLDIRSIYAVRTTRSRVLAWSIAASIALHVAVLLAFPQIGRHDTASVEVLTVTLLRVEPPRPLPTRSEPPAPPAAKKPEPARKETPPALEKKVQRPAAVEEARPPVLALPQPAAPAEPSFSAPAAEPRPAAEAPAAPREAARAGPARESEGAAGDKTTPPVFNAAYLRNPEPRYPVSARRRGEQGTVLLKVLVTREGGAASVNVEKSSGSSALDQAALDAVKGWRFVPARQGAHPVEAWVLVPIVFRLEGAS